MFCAARFGGTVLQCGAWLQKLILNYSIIYVVSGASFFNWSVFEWNIARGRSMAILCMLYKIRCNIRPLLYGALLVPYMPLHVTPGAYVADRYTYSPPLCRSSETFRTFILVSVSL